ncbi:DUF5819 family protein [Ruania halotolerans]|uniref:DUF5819 family protein n=1 Tax=Ruania halotolerans TaxID=2897773 RepID=UPI001E4F0175|nr:DUF5819 family protein [Ruania halotolerans]UFU07219.1 DUF5819 family protein [Ruania halotolerans]
MTSKNSESVETASDAGSPGDAKPDKSPATEQPRTPMTTLKRIVVVVAVLFTAWHVLATFLWIAPASGLRQMVPGEMLRDYMIPMHGQSWSVFAPEPINGDYRMQIRATVTENGTTRETDWVDATAAELEMLTHNLTPPRAAITASELSGRFRNAYLDLNGEQQDIVALGYYTGDDWRDRMGDALLSYGNENAVADYLELEETVTAYSTQVAYAMWGDGVVHVQFVVSRQNVIPFGQRNEPDAERPAVQPVPTGWRGLIEYEGQSRERFGAIFREAVRESTR